MVNAHEYFVIWRGKRNKLRMELRKATSYKEWMKAADALDSYLNNHSWKENDEVICLIITTYCLVIIVRFSLNKKNYKDFKLFYSCYQKF